MITESKSKAEQRDINALIEIIKKNDPEADAEIVKKAYDIACKAHDGQVRLSGEPYIIHPLEVAVTLAELNLDITSICAALLHDVVEDTTYSMEYLAEIFSDDVAMLVDGVTKISSLKNQSKTRAQAETLRKMLLATVKDVRVIIIKLADKLHNMSTIEFQPAHKQQRIAKETLDIYAPIARRLGMSRFAAILEDLSFFVLDKDEFNYIKDQIDHKQAEFDSYIENVRNIISDKLKELNINAIIKGRVKSFYSIYRKMAANSKSFDEIYDIRGIRVLTDEIKECYAALGIIHSIWSPIEGRFKDYIAVPKSNMYQSLHTNVIGPEGMPLEIQIRTKDMDTTAEMGIASHWIYKSEDRNFNPDYKKLSILNNLNSINIDKMNTRDFVSTVKMDLYDDEIFVFTPKGEIIKLPAGSTPIDFAYAIHTEVGNRCSGAKVNNKLIPLKTKLKSGEIVEILTSKNAHPVDAWLKIVKSGSARYKIRNWLKKINEEYSKTEDELKRKEDKKKEVKKANFIIPESEKIKVNNLSSSKINVSIEGNNNVLTKLAQCCQPIPGDEVIGFITRGRGITIHKKRCPSIKKLKSESERFIDIIWQEDDASNKNMYPVKMTVESIDRPFLLKDITDEISLAKSNIIKVEAQSNVKGVAVLKFIIEVTSNEHLTDIIKRIKTINSITNVYKINEKVIIK
ncbi:MAG: bifunctional (p)ppGpp synthetase/guanosine-3',5'-bis(diphosphate) 3'-pyrophosphohydrolase [Leptospirales bacterium]|nr:bifunctional (p)ppGpp synthetase/guanosine-3',5'-bis(diphosphate) 3'-pyrophosphohydrolase [Leptospirales bacterium]